jgi:hypothetical protein
MSVSERDREAFRRQAAALDEVETDEEATGDRLEAEIAEANRWRRAHGIPPLGDDTDRPERGLHELARARGLIHPVR